MPVQMTYTGTLVITTCWCGIPHGIPQDLYNHARQHKGKGVYCPLGHSWVFTTTVEEKLERERERHQATKDLLLQEERSHSATKGQMTKLRKRVEKGVCPHCKRHFANLQRHVETKHAETSAA